MSDRICIHSQGNLQVFVSAEDLLACCSQCGKGCLGGEIPRAWWYWQAYGRVRQTGNPQHFFKSCFKV